MKEEMIIFWIKIKAYAAMLFLQFGYAGMYIITMLCLKRGMSHWVLVVYRHAAAFLFIAPFALFLERKIRPKLTISAVIKILLLGLLEPVIDQNLYYVGMKYTSATFTAAMVNVLPAITFILALILRLEKVDVKKVHSQAKILGTVITVGGAMLMTLYKGPIVNILWYASGSGSHHSSATASSGHEHWVAGTLMLLACTFGWSGFFVLQSITLREYPAELSLTTLICLAGMLEGGVVALFMERNNMTAWIVGFDSRLLAAVYSGVVCSGIAYYVQGVVNKERGPVFLTAFSPLSMIITAVLGAIILSEQVHLGSLIGAIIIVSGLYFVVWGKSKDYKLTDEDGKSKTQELLPTTTTSVLTNAKAANFDDDVITEPAAKHFKTIH